MPHKKERPKGTTGRETTGTKDSDIRRRTMPELQTSQPHARNVARGMRAGIALDPTTVSDVDGKATWQETATLELVGQPGETICQEEPDRITGTRELAITRNSHVETTTIAKIIAHSSSNPRELGTLTQTPSRLPGSGTVITAKDVSM